MGRPACAPDAPPAAAQAYRHPLAAWQVGLQLAVVYAVCLLWCLFGIRGLWEDILQRMDPGGWLAAVGARPQGPEGPALLRFAGVAAATHSAIVVAGVRLGHWAWWEWGARAPARVGVLAAATAAFFVSCRCGLAAGWAAEGSLVRDLGVLFFTDDARGAEGFPLLGAVSMSAWLAGAVVFSFTDPALAGVLPAVVARYLAPVVGFFCAQVLFFAMCVPLWNTAARHWFAAWLPSPPPEAPFDSSFVPSFSVLAACTHTVALSFGTATCHWATAVGKSLSSGCCDIKSRWRARAARAAWAGLVINALIVAVLCVGFAAGMSRWVSFALRARVGHVWGVARAFVGPSAAEAEARMAEDASVVFCLLCSPAHALIISSYVLWFGAGAVFEQRWRGSATNRALRRARAELTPTPMGQAVWTTVACGGAAAAALLAAVRGGAAAGAVAGLRGGAVEDAAAAAMCALFGACSVGPWAVVLACRYLPRAVPDGFAQACIVYTLWNAHTQWYAATIVPFAVTPGCAWAERVHAWFFFVATGPSPLILLNTAGAAAARKLRTPWRPRHRVGVLVFAGGLAWANVAAQLSEWGPGPHTAAGLPYTTLVTTCAFHLYVLQTYVPAPETHASGPCSRLVADLPSWRGVWPLVIDYFPIRVVADAPADPLRPRTPYLLCYHPHGIIPYTMALMRLSPDWARLFPGVVPRACTDFVTHLIPGMRDILQWSGSLDVSRPTILRALRARHALTLVPGGQEEMLESASWAKEVRVFKGHRGFVRLAIETGVPLVPVFGFGEWELLDNVYLPRVQDVTKRVLGWPFPFFPYGRPAPGQMPRRGKALTIIVGAPVAPAPGAKHTDEAAVAEMHGRYFAALQAMFDRHKAAAGYPDHSLRPYDRAARVKAARSSPPQSPPR